MNKEYKQLIFFTLCFGAIPFLFFHAFLFSLLKYKDALEFPLFVVFPLMWLCFSRVSAFMPDHMHHLMRRGGSKNYHKNTINHPLVEMLIWYPIIFIFYYQLGFSLNFFDEFDEMIELSEIAVGYGAFFFASIIGGLISIYVIENMSSLKKHSLPISWGKIKNRLVSVFISYFGVALFFSGLYRWISRNIDRSFSNSIDSTLDSIYFSVVTITTLGYGDISPTHASSKIAVIFQSLLGVMFLAIMIGLIISISLVETDDSETANKQINQD